MIENAKVDLFDPVFEILIKKASWKKTLDRKKTELDLTKIAYPSLKHKQ